MGIVSKLTKRIEVPGEPGQWIQIRMLSWLTLDKAKKERVKEILGMSAMFALIKDIPSNGAAETARAQAIEDRLNSYDRLTLLQSGIDAWSYEGVVEPEQLDERTAEWAAREILAYTLPDEAQTKTPSSLSTGT